MNALYKVTSTDSFSCVGFGERLLTNMKHSYADTTAYMFEIVLILLLDMGGRTQPKNKP